MGDGGGDGQRSQDRVPCPRYGTWYTLAQAMNCARHDKSEGCATAQHGKCKAIITRSSARSIGLADIYAVADYYYGRARTSKRCHASFYRKVFSTVVSVHTCDTRTRMGLSLSPSLSLSLSL